MIQHWYSHGIRLFHRNLPLRFLIAGVCNTLFSTMLFMLLLWLGFGIALGSALALATGVFFSYQVQGTVVFRHKSLSAFVRFALTWTIIYLCNLLEIKGMMDLGLNHYEAGVLATIPTTIVSYFVQKAFVFRISEASIRPREE